MTAGCENAARKGRRFNIPACLSTSTHVPQAMRVADIVLQVGGQPFQDFAGPLVGAVGFVALQRRAKVKHHSSPSSCAGPFLGARLPQVRIIGGSSRPISRPGEHLPRRRIVPLRRRVGGACGRASQARCVTASFRQIAEILPDLGRQAFEKAAFAVLAIAPDKLRQGAGAGHPNSPSVRFR